MTTRVMSECLHSGGEETVDKVRSFLYASGDREMVEELLKDVVSLILHSEINWCVVNTKSGEEETRGRDIFLCVIGDNTSEDSLE